MQRKTLKACLLQNPQSAETRFRITESAAISVFHAPYYIYTMRGVHNSILDTFRCLILLMTDFILTEKVQKTAKKRNNAHPSYYK